MKRISLITLGLILHVSSFSQKNLLTVERNIGEFVVENTLCRQFEYVYSNQSDSTYILWIEKDNVGSLSNYKKIRKHFYSNHGGDFTLMQLLWDGNVGNFTPGFFDEFMKIIKPKEQFTVSFLNRGKDMTDSELSFFFENQIVIVNSTEIKGLEINSSINMFNYPAKTVTILADWLTKK
jgi:hypothetical protein